MNIGNYLKKITQIVPIETKVRDTVIQAVADVLGIPLQRSQITLSRGVVSINTQSAIKTEIILKQVKILARIAELDPELKIKKVQ